MNKIFTKINKFSLLAGDIIFFYGALLITLAFRYQDRFNLVIWHNHWTLFTGVLIIWLLVFYAFDLYDTYLNNRGLDFLNNFLKAISINLVFGILYFYISSPKTSISPKTILVILTVIYSIFLFFWHKIITRLFSSKKLYKNLLLVGYQETADELLPTKPPYQKFGYIFKGIAGVNPETAQKINLPHYQIANLTEVIKKEKIDLLVIADTDNQNTTDLLFKILPLRVNFVTLSNFYEQTTERIPLKIINRGWFLENFSEGNKKIMELSKRLIDVSFSFVFGLFSLIIIPFIVLAIKIDSNGKVIFKQVRLGKDGKPFLALKFRSMYENAEENGPMWAKKNDPRVTKVGRFLRQSRLDEIPQLWNILRGEMSFVGPRPERPEFIEQLKQEIPFYKERLLVKPGLTGWAQIRFPYADSVDSSLKKLQYDLYYIKHRSVFFDLGIILKTVNIIFKKVGR